MYLARQVKSRNLIPFPIESAALWGQRHYLYLATTYGLGVYNLTASS